jgi:hypothetical protein
MNSFNSKKVYRCFKECLALGQEYEVMALEKIKKLNSVDVKQTQTKDNFKIMFHDFETMDDLKYEVKADFASEVSGNFFCEFAIMDKPSGLLISDADFYIIVSCGIFHLINIDKLKELTLVARIARTRYGSEGYIISMTDIKANSQII